MARMNMPPMITPRLISLLDLTVMNLMTSWGIAKTPIPTPMTIVDIRVHHHGLPKAGIDVQPVCPWAARFCGTMEAMFVRAWWAALIPPRWE